MTKATHTPGPRDDGGLYVHVDEEGDAISVAMNGRAPNGGWTGVSVARMALPKARWLTREQVNGFAAMFATAPATAAERDRLLEVNAELLEALEGAQFSGPGHTCAWCGGSPATGHVANRYGHPCKTGAANSKEGSLLLPLLRQCVSHARKAGIARKIQGEFAKIEKGFPKKRVEEVSEAYLEFKMLKESLAE